MIAASNHESGIRQSLHHGFESFDHELEPLVCAPLSESQDAMLRITAP